MKSGNDDKKEDEKAEERLASIVLLFQDEPYLQFYHYFKVELKIWQIALFNWWKMGQAFRQQ